MKTKKTKIKKTSVVRKPKIKKYPSHYLAIVMLLALWIEGMLIGSAQPADWQKGMQVLDLSSGIMETSHDTLESLQPMIEVVTSVNLFYEQSADAMSDLLDVSDSTPDLTLAFDGVEAFYDSASKQMASVLDMSETSRWPAIVSGISIER